MGDIGRMFFHGSILSFEKFLISVIIVNIDSVVMRADEKEIETKFDLRYPLLSMSEFLKHFHLFAFFIKSKNADCSFFAPDNNEASVWRNTHTSAF